MVLKRVLKREKVKGCRADVINYCQSKGIKFAIGADLDKAVARGIREIREEGRNRQRR